MVPGWYTRPGYLGLISLQEKPPGPRAQYDASVNARA